MFSCHRMKLAGMLLLVSLCDLVTSEAAHYPAPPSYCPAPQACVPPVLCPTDYPASLYDLQVILASHWSILIT